MQIGAWAAAPQGVAWSQQHQRCSGGVQHPTRPRAAVVPRVASGHVAADGTPNSAQVSFWSPLEPPRIHSAPVYCCPVNAASTLLSHYHVAKDAPTVDCSRHLCAVAWLNRCRIVACRLCWTVTKGCCGSIICTSRRWVTGSAVC